MKKMNFVAFFLLLFVVPSFAQQQMITKPIYDNTKFEEEIKPYKIPARFRYALVENEVRQLIATPYSLCYRGGNYLKNIDPFQKEALPIRKSEYKFGIFLLHIPGNKPL